MASLSQTNSTGESTQINLLKTRLDARIAGEYWLGSVNIIYHGASFGVIEVDPTVTDPTVRYARLMSRCISIRKEKQNALSRWINPVHSTAL